MKKAVLVMILFIMGFSTQAQFPFGNEFTKPHKVKIKRKTGMVYVDKEEYLVMKGDGFSSNLQFFDITGSNEVAYAVRRTFNDPNKYDVNSDNPSMVVYWELHFYVNGEDRFCEVLPTLPSMLVNEFASFNLFNNGGMSDTVNINKYLSRTGKTFTERQNQIKEMPVGQPQRIIVVEDRDNNQQNSNPPRNRVGVKIGGVEVEMND